MDRQALREALENVFNDYAAKRVEELIGVSKGASRLNNERDVYLTIGKAAAARELLPRVITQLGL